MILPPLPLDPNGQEWTDDEAKIIQAYALLAIKEYKASVSKMCSSNRKKFSDSEAAYIRQLHANGWTYKQVYKHNKMSEVTFINIIKRKGAYK
jgi:hypothetical protein